ncbi:hypothetical protein EBS40_09370 [bacterium]|nr:hypothetical protein [bacterium]
MSKLIMLKGLPASGKSTWAKEQVRLSKGKTKRVNKDDLRAMIDDGEWSKQNEKLILEIRDELVFKFLMQGYDVIVDDTNLAPKHEKDLHAILKMVEAGSWFPGGESNMEFEVKWFDTPLAECIRRDMLRPNPVGKKVIRRFYTDDDRDDRIVKKEIFDAWIKDRYNVKFVLDDRNRVVEMWRSLGLKVLQVGEGDF